MTKNNNGENLDGLYLCAHNFLSNHSYVLKLNLSNQEIEVIAERPPNKTHVGDYVYSFNSDGFLYLDRGKLFDVWSTPQDSFIFNTINDSRGRKALSKSDGHITQVYAQDNKLYYVWYNGNEENGLYHKIYDKDPTKKGIKPIATRNRAIHAICSHKNVLYDSSDETFCDDGRAGVYKTLDNKLIFEANRMEENTFVELITYNGNLYGSRIDGIIFDILNKKPVAKRKCWSRFIVLNDRLLDFSHNKFFDTLSDPAELQPVLNVRGGKIIHFVNHGNTLYDVRQFGEEYNGGEYAIFSTQDNRLLASLDEKLCGEIFSFTSISDNKINSQSLSRRD